LISKKRHYILLVSRDEDGTLHKVPIPLHYVYGFVGAAIIGLFTMAGLAGSYTRMLVKTERFNQLRQDHQNLQKDYAHLERQAHEKDIQAASLGSLANEVSALYGLTAGKIGTIRAPHFGRKGTAAPATLAATAPLKDASTFNNDAYYKSVDAFYALRASAMDGDAALQLDSTANLGRMINPLLPGHELPGLGSGSVLEAANSPNIWPVTGPISSSFGERIDPVLGNGEGEFHPGMDISGPLGTPIHATADGVVAAAEVVNGYGRMVKIDHGHGVQTLYGHMSGFAVTAGQAITRGQIVGYIGHSGRATGNHVHYEVRINNIPVNPHKYLRTTLAEFLATAKPMMP
jgi:murein DD-endopeptidase MepM/ murein hydrolase activator NlpD